MIYVAFESWFCHLHITSTGGCGYWDNICTVLGTALGIMVKKKAGFHCILPDIFVPDQVPDEASDVRHSPWPLQDSRNLLG